MHMRAARRRAAIARSSLLLSPAGPSKSMVPALTEIVPLLSTRAVVWAAGGFTGRARSARAFVLSCAKAPQARAGWVHANQLPDFTCMKLSCVVLSLRAFDHGRTTPQPSCDAPACGAPAALKALTARGVTGAIHFTISVLLCPQRNCSSAGRYRRGDFLDFLHNMADVAGKGVMHCKTHLSSD